MGKLLCMMGKSASGKDTIYKALVEDSTLGLHTVVPYTTRPVRDGEAEGENYHFVTEEVYGRMAGEGKIIEARTYDTVHGLWRYFTADDGQIDFSKGNFIVIGTLEAYIQFINYFGKESIIPIYINVDDGLRLMRAVSREMQQKQPKYAELCRRFLADCEDFSEEKLQQARIEKAYDNYSLDECITQVKEDICHMLHI